ncbi:hypothetical protein [Bacillus cereus]
MQLELKKPTLNVEKKPNKSLWNTIKKQKSLVLMSIPFIIYVFIFCYAPLVGWVMAFQNFKPAKGLFNQVWVGLDQFKFLFADPTFLKVIRNTLAMSLINLTLSFVCSIGFALLLNEVKNMLAKKFVQTVSYLPHFLSWIIVTGIVAEVLSPETGIINQLLVWFNVLEKPINFFAETK